MGQASRPKSSRKGIGVYTPTPAPKAETSSASTVVDAGARQLHLLQLAAEEGEERVHRLLCE
jgi:hypothetical protein